MDPRLLQLAKNTRGFMPDDEGLSLWEVAHNHVSTKSPMLEIGSYCGKSTVYLGTAAKETNKVLFALDHHRGSEENQCGWEWHEPDLVDPRVGKLDTLPTFRETIAKANLEDTVVALVGSSAMIAPHWNTPLSLLFIDGGHGTIPAHQDYEFWTPWVEPGGLLLIHDVFPNPADGGRPPYEIYCRALESKLFIDVESTGSLRVLQRISL